MKKRNFFKTMCWLLMTTVVMSSCSKDEEDNVAVTGISLDESALTLAIGEEVTLKATVLPEDATDNTITWKSSDNGTATVVNGKVTGIATGTATITAKAGDKTATCEVTVVEAIVKAKYIEKLPALIYANAVVFPYRIQWEPVEGATGYNIYKSKSGSVSIVSSVGQTSTFIETDETITYEGNTTCHYWVTTITKNGESKRPENGGVKVTYHVVKQCYYGVPCFYNCSRTIEQNSGK